MAINGLLGVFGGADCDSNKSVCIYESCGVTLFSYACLCKVYMDCANLYTNVTMNPVYESKRLWLLCKTNIARIAFVLCS